MGVQIAQLANVCAITWVRAVLWLSEISPFFALKEKFYDKNSTDITQQWKARPQLVRVSIVRIQTIFTPAFSVTCIGDIAERSFNCINGNFSSTWPQINEEGCELFTFLHLRDNWNDFSVVRRLSMVTSSRIGPLPLSKYSKDVNIQNSQFISHRMFSWYS